MIRRRAARLLLSSIAVPVVFGCSTVVTTSTAPSRAAIGVPVGHDRSPVAELVVAAREAATTNSVPVTTITVPLPAPVPAQPANADPNEMEVAPTTTATPAPVAAMTRRATPVPSAASAAPAPAEPLAPAATGVRMDPAAAADFAARTNSLRASIGLPALARNGQLDALAAGWARELATSGSLRHSSIPNRVVAGGGWNTAGENVGTGGGVGSVHNALVNSAGHYANLAGAQYSAFGIAVAIGEDGRLWVCEVFAG